MIFPPLMNIGILFVICLMENIMMYDIEKYTMRLRKLSGDPLTGAIGAGIGVIGDTLGLVGTEDEISTNVAENEKNRKFNAEEAEKQRAWSHDEWNYQFGKQTDEWYSQQDYSNAQAFDYWSRQQDYNSPSAQVSRLQKAGLNPAHVVGDTTFGSTGLSAAPTSVPNPSVPSGHAASVGLSNPASPGAKAQAFANMAKGISDVLNSVYGAKRSAAETKKTEQTLDPIIKGLLLDNSNKQLVNTWQNLDNMEKEKGMPDRLKNLSHQGKLLIAQAMAATSSSDLMKVQASLDNLRKDLVSKEIDIKGKELLIVTAEADNIQTAIDLKNELMRQQAKTERSKQAANYASASESYSTSRLNDAKKLTEDLIRTPKVWGQQIVNSLGRGEMRLQDVRLKLENIRLSKEEASKVLLELEKERARSIIENRQNDPSFRLLDDLIYEVKDIFHVGVGYVAGDKKQPTSVHRERHNDKGEYLYDDEYYNYHR